MGVIFLDNFTEATTDTNLDSHTPDTGTSWVLDGGSATVTLQALQATDTMGASGNESGVSKGYYGQPDPSTADYDIEFTFAAVDTGSANRYFFVLGRWVDQNNYYALGVRPTGHASSSLDLRKRAASSNSSLGNYDAALAASTAIKIEFRTNSQKVYVDGVERITATDSALTDAGGYGVYWGRDPGNSFAGGNIHSNWRIDGFTVTEPAAGGIAVATVVPLRMLMGVGL